MGLQAGSRRVAHRLKGPVSEFLLSEPRFIGIVRLRPCRLCPLVDSCSDDSLLLRGEFLLALPHLIEGYLLPEVARRRNAGNDRRPGFSAFH